MPHPIGIAMSTKEELYDEADKLKEEGKLEEAVAKLELCLQMDPNYVLAHHALARFCSRLNLHDKAIKHGLKVVELEPNDAFSFTALSVTYQRAGKIPEAEDAKARAGMIHARY